MREKKETYTEVSCLMFLLRQIKESQQCLRLRHVSKLLSGHCIAKHVFLVFLSCFPSKNIYTLMKKQDTFMRYGNLHTIR